ncbi:hypothetical protein [Nonomuraea dietziae]|uniref:hypothetical protein n=1 Tax=Nonomuraea dietziae TaxID=65515 RepID=UPI0031D14C57
MPTALTFAERAMLLTGRARALAKLGRVQETLATVGQADEQFARIHPAEEAPWMRYYDAAQHAGDTGHALFDLAMTRGQFVSEASGDSRRLWPGTPPPTCARVRSAASNSPPSPWRPVTLMRRRRSAPAR